MTDAISRSRVLEALEAEKARLMEQKDAGWPFTTEVLVRAVDTVHEFIKGLPALDVAPVVHAHWIKVLGGNGLVSTIRCSKCDNCDNPSYIPGNYCWFCGAKMDEKEKTRD